MLESPADVRLITGHESADYKAAASRGLSWCSYRLQHHDVAGRRVSLRGVEQTGVFERMYY